MITQTTVLDKPTRAAQMARCGRSTSPDADSRPVEEPLLRAALGEALRAFRVRSSLTLRELSDIATVSPGYLSEIERGRKEVSSELLAAVCHALGVRVSDVLMEAIGIMALEAETAGFRAKLDATM